MEVELCDRQEKCEDLPRALAVVSRRYRCIWLSIAKNASSTLRAELRQERFEPYEDSYRRLDAEVRRTYFTFAFVRHPVTRFLSAYQEISMRLEAPGADASRFAFEALPAGLPRLESFLDRAEQGLWDQHLKRQVDFLEGVRLDFLGRVETLEADLAAVCARIGADPPAELPRRRSREERARVYGYDRHWLREEELPERLADRVRRLYARDLELWHGVPDRGQRAARPPAAGGCSARRARPWQPPRVTKQMGR